MGAGEGRVTVGDGNRTRMTSLEDRWRVPIGTLWKGSILLAAELEGVAVAVIDRRLPSRMARM
jgi:hypothetical protein